MGACQNCAQKAEEVATEATSATYHEVSQTPALQVNENARPMEKSAEAHMKDVGTKVDEAKDPVEKGGGEIKEVNVMVDGIGMVEEEIPDYCCDPDALKAEEKLNAANGPIVGAIQSEETVEANAEECKEGEQAQPLDPKAFKEQPLLLEFGKKIKRFEYFYGTKKELKDEERRVLIEFSYKPVGFEFENGEPLKTGCACTKISKGPLKVTKVVAGQQGHNLGVEIGASIYIAWNNGTEQKVVDKSQLQDLISKLPEKEVPTVTF